VSDLALAAVLAGTILLASTISVELGLSVALIELLAGVIVGNTAHVVVPSWLTFVGSFAGIVLTFQAGAEVDVPQLVREWKASVSIGLVSFFAPFAVVACLRNCAAVGRFVASALRIALVERVTLVAAGEQWKADWPGPERARFAIEDWLGAGAIASECRRGNVTLSSEAEVAARAFDASRGDVTAILSESLSGRELASWGFDADVSLAAAVAVDDGIPSLHRDGLIERLSFAVRPATAADRPFLFALKQATMGEYIVATFGSWDEATERRHFGPDLNRVAVISLDGHDVAMVEARSEGHDFYLANIQVTPECQGRGLGTRIVELLAAAAHARGRALVLRVLKVNGRARRFYERIGLEVTGELPHHWSMSSRSSRNQCGTPT
jgi:ribosomal protein S18 acetylase RimI-like enzyme